MARLHFSTLSDRGIRATNNDAFCAEKAGKYYVFGVAEGLSDPAPEENASAIAISCLREIAKEHPADPGKVLETVVRESDARISALRERFPEQGKDITHLSACLVDDALECTILDTGEGNAYLISGDSILLPRELVPSPHPGRTENHAPGPGMGDKGPVMIAHTLGEPRVLTKNDIISVNLTDRFLLLSSGGLHDFVGKERIKEIILANGENVEASGEFLLQEALSAGSAQAITLVLVHGHRH